MGEYRHVIVATGNNNAIVTKATEQKLGKYFRSQAVIAWELGLGDHDLNEYDGKKMLVKFFKEHFSSETQVENWMRTQGYTYHHNKDRYEVYAL